MTKARPPKEKPPNRKAIFCMVIISLVHLVAVALVLMSGLMIVWLYGNIIFGSIPDELQKIQLDYSISVFAGSAIYLLLYTYKAEDIIKKLLNVKEVPPLEK